MYNSHVGDLFSNKALSDDLTSSIFCLLSQLNGHLRTFAKNYARICFINHGRFVLYFVLLAST